MSDRPDYVVCIQRHAQDNSWCGRTHTTEFIFQDVEHALRNGENKGRLLTCGACCQAVHQALMEHAFDDDSTLTNESGGAS